MASALVHHLAVGLVASGAGCAAVYPVDVVKTRMQAAPTRYRGPVHCARNLWEEGKLYAGLGQQMLGVSPEKTLKLTAYTYALPLAYGAFGVAGAGSESICIPAEALAGAVGGLAQVIVTCPIEAQKIAKQLDGEAVSPYTGLLSTWARDIPSASIFFAVYTPIHVQLLESGVQPFVASLLAAMLAGVPAATLPTPADVVKTRLQDPAQAKEFKGPIDCLKRVADEEGIEALGVGAWARAARIAPQLGITLSLFELLEPTR